MRENKGRYAGRIEDLPLVDTPGLDNGITKRVGFGPGRFWGDHVARYFTCAPGVKTPFHSHDWPHYVFVINGDAIGTIGDDTYSLAPGSWAYVPPDIAHFFENIGNTDFNFL